MGENGAIEVVASHDLGALRDELARRLSTPVGSPAERVDRAFDPELIVVPSSHMRQYLERELARDLGSTGNDDGIVANIEFLQPRHLVYASVGELPARPNIRQVLGIGESPWDADRLTWIIDEVIRISGISVPSHETAPLTTSRRIAELFDHYTTHRPEMLRQWNDGGDSPGDDLAGRLQNGQVWQRDLYRAVSARIGSVHHLAVMNLDDWTSHVEQAREADLLPKRISVFAVTGLTRAARDVLRILAPHSQVTVYVLHAATSTWPESALAEHETREVWGHQLETSRPPSEHHPLHDRWCAHSLEHAALLGTPNSVLGTSINRSTLLGAMRADIVSNSSLTIPLRTEPELFAALSAGDGSLQVHSCFGPVRQAEALRDSLLRALRDDASLRLRDITVVCSDPAASAPVLNAVFNPGRHQGSPSAMPMLPINALGADSGGHTPIVEAFLAVMSLAQSRCSPADVLQVLALPAVAHHFDLDSDALQRISEWAEEAGVRHSISPTHRLAATNVPLDVSASTWSDALARVAVGVAVPAPVDVVGPGGVVPYDTVTSGDIAVFGAVAEFFDRLARLAEMLHTETGMSVDTWVATALRVVDDFLSVSNDDTELMVNLRAVITSIAHDVSHLTDASPVTAPTYPVAELLAATASRFAGEFSPYSSPWEAITVTTMDGLAHRPTRIVAVFGANEDMFAGPAADGDNVLANTPLVGEPHYAMAARQGLVHALLAATDAFILTCDGADVSNNKPIPLAVAVRELLEVAAATAATGSFNAGFPVALRHPRQNHHAATVTPGKMLAEEPFTFDPAAPRAHELAARAKQPDASRAVTTPPLAGNPSSDVSIADITRAVRNPLEHHVRSTLGVDLPQDSSEESQDEKRHISGDGVIPLTIDSLGYSAEGRRLLEHIVGNGDPDVSAEKWRMIRPQTGILPPGKLGRAIASDVAAEVRQLIEACPVAPGKGSEHECRVTRGVEHHNFIIKGLQSNPNCITRFRFKRFTESLLLEPWIELAVLTAATEGTWEGCAYFVARARNSSKAMPEARKLTIAGATPTARATSAHRVLDLTFDLHHAASRAQIPLFERASYAATLGRSSARDAFATDTKYSAEARFLLAGRSFADVRREKVTALERDLFGAEADAERFDFYASLLWNTFDSTCNVEQLSASPEGETDDND